MLEDAELVGVEVRDYSENIRPMPKVFYTLAGAPCFFISLFCLEKHFVNIVAVVRGYPGQRYWRHVAITATKPSESVEWAKTK